MFPEVKGLPHFLRGKSICILYQHYLTEINKHNEIFSDFGIQNVFKIGAT